MAILKLGKKITARNDQNTNNTSSTPIYGVIKYIINGEKTNEGTLVSNNYSNEQDAISLAEGMIFDLKQSPYAIGNNTRWALHLKHSFSPDEPVTPELAHKIGIELAEAITNGEYKYVVATHVDRHHVHNHIVISMAGQLPPHKHMQLKKDAIQQWRNINDELCKQYGLSVLEPAKSQPDRYAKTFEELYAEIKGMSRKQALRTMIDEAAITAATYQEFTDAIQERGIRVAMRGNNLVYTNLATGMKVRSSKLGYAYTPQAIMSRIQGQILGWISINETLIKSQNTNAITFYLPKSKRQLLMSVPREQLIESNRTYHIFFAEDAQIVLKDRRGRYVKTINKQDLYQYFGDKTLTALQQLSRSASTSKQHVVLGRSEAQNRFLRYQAIRIDQLNQQVDQLMQARQAHNMGISLQTRIDQLQNDMKTLQREMKACLTALIDAEQVGDHEAQQSVQAQLEQYEQDLTNTQQQLQELQRFTNPEHQRKRTLHTSRR